MTHVGTIASPFLWSCGTRMSLRFLLVTLLSLSRLPIVSIAFTLWFVFLDTSFWNFVDTCTMQYATGNLRIMSSRRLIDLSFSRIYRPLIGGKEWWREGLTYCDTAPILSRFIFNVHCLFPCLNSLTHCPDKFNQSINNWMKLVIPSHHQVIDFMGINSFLSLLSAYK